MAKEEGKKINDDKEIGLVVLTGEVGYGMKMPDGNVIEMQSEEGKAQVQAWIVKTIYEIKKNIS